MKVVHLSWSDRHGGAARAAFRLDSALKQAGIHSGILSAAGFLDDAGQRYPAKAIDSLLTRASARLDQLPLIVYPNREAVLFSPARASEHLLRRAKSVDADLFHLHWINNGFMKIETLPKLSKPVVWTLHDMWPFTGGCHYSNGCQNYLSSCGACPQLHSRRSDDLSRRTFLRKQLAWKESQVQVVTPSRWLATVASSSKLLGRSVINTIPNAIDTTIFAPVDKNLARASFGLPGEGIILLFGALTGDGDQRKGFHFVAPLLAKLAEHYSRNQIRLAILGMEQPVKSQTFPFPVTYLGLLADDVAIARAYSSADILIVPSIEDNLPNSVMEASSCGVPSAAFRIGGLPEMILHTRSGYLAEPFDVDEFAAGVSSLIQEREIAAQAGARAREHVIENYSYQAVSRRHIDLYSSLLN